MARFPSWLNLNEVWEVTFDEATQRLYENWQHLGHFDRLITVPFSFDVTEFLSNEKLNRVVVYVEDTPSKLQPRGKQYWKPQNEGCFYTRTSGIWQTVWLEAVPPVYMKYTQIKSDIDAENVLITCN